MRVVLTADSINGNLLKEQITTKIQICNYMIIQVDLVTGKC